jgi:hypothetical protein
MRGKFWIGFLALAAASGCGTASRQAGAGEDTTAAGEDRTIQVTVENNLQPPVMVTVWLREQIGSRRTLGDVGPLDTRTFSFDPVLNSGTYRLEARPTAGEELLSEPLTLFAGDAVQWKLRGNLINR